MDRRSSLGLLGSFLLTGCGSTAGRIKANSSTAKTSPKADKESEIKQVSSEDVDPNNVFKVKFETTAGNFIIEVHRDWAPIGAERFHELVEARFYDGCKFFRVMRDPEPFMAQFGINGDPAVSAEWREKTIKDDDVRRSNKPGFVTFAKTGAPNSRTTQVFVNYRVNAPLDNQGFAPFGKVIDGGMKVVESLYSGYGNKPSEEQDKIQFQGNKFLESKYPNLDSIITARFVTDDA